MRIPSLSLAVASLLFFPSTLMSQTVVRSAVSEEDMAPDEGTNTHTIEDFEVVAGTNRKLVVVVGRETDLPFGVSYGGVDLFEAKSQKTGNSLAAIWCLDSPEVGLGDVEVNGDGAGSSVGVRSLQGAAPGGFLTNVVSSANQISYSTTVANTLVVSGYTDNDGGSPSSLVVPTGLNELYLDGGGLSARVVGAYGNLATAGSCTEVFGDSINSPTIALAGFIPYDPALIYIVSSAVNYDGDGGGDSNTIENFTVTEGIGRKLVLSINSEAAGSIESITYGEQFFSPVVASAGAGRYSQVWRLDAPAVGTEDIVAIYTESGRSRMGVVSLQNAAPGEASVSN